MSDLTERLRENDEMLRDGLQLPGLTEAWHNVVMKQAAKDSLEAATLIDQQASVIRELVEALQLMLDAYEGVYNCLGKDWIPYRDDEAKEAAEVACAAIAKALP